MAGGEGDAFKEDAAAGEEAAIDAEEAVQGSEKRMLQSVVEQFMGKETVRSPGPHSVPCALAHPVCVVADAWEAMTSGESGWICYK